MKKSFTGFWTVAALMASGAVSAHAEVSCTDRIQKIAAEAPISLLRGLLAEAAAVKPKAVKIGRYVSVVDFSRKSSQKRFFVIDLQTGHVEAVHTSHGRKSDPDGDGRATSFSDAFGSNQSSLGLYRVGEPDSHGEGSSKLIGLDAHTKNTESRGICLREKETTSEAGGFAKPTEGCFALSPEIYSKDKRIFSGSLLYSGIASKWDYERVQPATALKICAQLNQSRRTVSLPGANLNAVIPASENESSGSSEP